MPDRRAYQVIDHQVIARALDATAQEMGICLLRNAFSSIVREAKDMSTAVFDADGRLVAQADHIPILQSAMATALGACLAEQDVASLTPDTLLITNDPYRGCHHLNDIAVFLPVFRDRQRIAFVGAIAHHLDVGGSAAGMLPAAHEIREEGICIPPLAFTLADGALPPLLLSLLEANVRAPVETIGDLHAQLAALHAGRDRVVALAGKYGVTVLAETMAALIAGSERAMRGLIAALPDFAVTGRSALDDDGQGGPPLEVVVAIRKSGSDLRLDFTGSSAQRATMCNANVSSTLGAVWTAARNVFCSGTRMNHNAGTVAPIEVMVPSGSFLDPLPPASVHARVLVAYRVYDAVMDALAKALPDRVTATGFNSSICLALSCARDGRYDIFVEVLSGGWGARSTSDGPDALPFPLSNCSNVPAEFIEARYKFLRLRSYALDPGSGGVGRYRGGLGEVKEYEILADDVMFTVFTDRFTEGAPGVFGGGSGKPGRMEIQRGNSVLPLTSKTGTLLQRGDLLRIVGGGGGGYGPAGARDAALHADDILRGVVAA